MNVGVVGDLHLPFTHPMYLDFCRDTFKRWKVNSVVFIGDVVDHHALSRFVHDPNGLSAESEFLAAQAGVWRWRKAFPTARVCIGNHDDRCYRTAREAGLPDRYLKTYKEIWDTPDWDWQLEFVIDGMYYFHGTGCSGKFAAYNQAIERRMSTAMGHVHSNGGVMCHTNPTSRVVGVAVGCGVDIDAYALAYGKPSPKRPVLGCAVVIDGEQAMFAPMPLSRGEKYNRRRAKRRKAA